MNDYTIAKGSHSTPQEGRCAMEWVAYLAGEPHSDAPVCVSPLLRQFGIALNDQWGDEQRQKLRPYLARCIGTAGDGRDVERSWLAWDWLLREFVPSFMELTPALIVHAERLRALPPCLAVEGMDEAMRVLGEARKTSAAAGAAWEAAWAAAGAAAWSAAGAARAAAGDAARAAAGDAARDAAWAARDAAWAARAAAGGAARAAAWEAARGALAPTVERLQASVLDLFDRMLPTEVIQIPVTADWREVVGA